MDPYSSPLHNPPEYCNCHMLFLHSLETPGKFWASACEDDGTVDWKKKSTALPTQGNPSCRAGQNHGPSFCVPTKSIQCGLYNLGQTRKTRKPPDRQGTEAKANFKDVARGLQLAVHEDMHGILPIVGFPALDSEMGRSIGFV